MEITPPKGGVTETDNMFFEVALLCVTCFLLVKLFQLNAKPHGTPPGPKGLPIIGTMPSKNQTFPNFVNHYKKIYGDIMMITFGCHTNVILSRHEDIVAAFNNPALQGRSELYSVQLLYKYGVKDIHQQKKYITNIQGIVNSEGEGWKNVRRFVIRRLRDGGMGKSSSMEGIILREAEALVEDFEKHVGKPTEIPWSVNASILNVVWELIGSRRYDIFDEEIQLLCNNLNDVLTIMQEKMFILDMFPMFTYISPDFILNFFGKKEFEEKVERIYSMMHKTVEEHKKTLDEDNPRDLIDSYLIDLKQQENDSPNKPEYSSTFSERELTQTLFDLFVAGSETTSSSTRWFIFFMAKYNRIQNKLQDEIDNAIPKGSIITLADKEKLPYLESCISETLRLKPILPFGVPHAATEDTTIGEYLIPKGVRVFSNMTGCHRDPKYWEKPNEFYPEHFINTDGTFNSKTPGLIPFSIGRRMCPGENLAKMDLFLILGMLMQKFTFTVPDGEPMSEEAIPNQPMFTLPKPFKIIINKR